MIYLVAPNATHPSGGVGVAAQWVRLLNEKGYPATFITPNGDPSPFWLNFTVPAGSYADMEDKPENKRVDVWMDCMVERPRQAMQGYFFAQDVCQLEHIKAERGGPAYLETLKHLGYTKLITIGAHSQAYYLYRFGIPSKVVNNWVDTELFQPLTKAARSVCLIQHRDHFNPEIPPLLTAAGYTVRIAQGTQAEVAEAMGESEFFISDVRGRFDGFAYSEGFPMPIAEAMAAGCVVLCRDTGGVREYVLDGVNGIFYEDIAEIPGKMEGSCPPPPYLNIPSIPKNASWTMAAKFSRENAWNQIREALELT